MSNIDELVPSQSKYLKKEDVGEAGKNLTIKGFKIVEIETDGTTEQRAIIGWEDDVKPMVLNKTNKEILKVIFKTTDTTEMVGQKVNVYNDPLISFGDRITGGIRLRHAKGIDKAEELDDEIPF